MSTPSLGEHDVDLRVLLETRLLVQAQSGGGKSWALRRVLEQTAPHVQQLVLDPEGEFHSLREKFDYIVCAPHDADAIATPQTAALLARRLWESGTSAVLNIYDLRAHERRLFVRRFLEALVDAPKKLWHPTLVVLDEAHVYAPQTGKAESLGAVIDIATRGRKRGLCLVPATQRLSKLHKDVAAEMMNKLIGRAGMDVDVSRAADELGMTRRQAMDALRDLSPGEFYVFGPALCNGVEKTRIGPVTTSHPQAGQRLLEAPPPPSKAVLKKLSELADLQTEAEQEARTVEELRAQATDLKRRLTLAEKRAAQAGVPEKEVKKREDTAFRQGLSEGQKAAKTGAIPETVLRSLSSIHSLAEQALKEAAGTAGRRRAAPKVEAHVAKTLDAPPARQPLHPPRSTSGGSLRKGAVKILAELAARYPAGYSKAQVGTLTGYSHKGGTFNTYLSDLRRLGYIEEREGLIFASEAGIESIGDRVPDTPSTHEDVMALWRRALRAGAYRMLEAIVAAGDSGIDKTTLAFDVAMEPTGGTFNTYLSDLRRNGLINDSGGHYTANSILFPEVPA